MAIKTIVITLRIEKFKIVVSGCCLIGLLIMLLNEHACVVSSIWVIFFPTTCHPISLMGDDELLIFVFSRAEDTEGLSGNEIGLIMKLRDSTCDVNLILLALDVDITCLDDRQLSKSISTLIPIYMNLFIWVKVFGDYKQHEAY